MSVPSFSECRTRIFDRNATIGALMLQEVELVGKEPFHLKVLKKGNDTVYIREGSRPQFLLFEKSAAKALTLDPGRYEFSIRSLSFVGSDHCPALLLGPGAGNADIDGTKVFCRHRFGDTYIANFELEEPIQRLIVELSAEMSETLISEMVLKDWGEDEVSYLNRSSFAIKRLTALRGRAFYGMAENEVAGALICSVTNTDPQMILVDDETGRDLRLPRGRYRFLFQARVTKGKLFRPRIYLDLGAGFSEDPAASFFLEPAAGDLWCVNFEIKSNAIVVRFDPTEAIASFTLLRMDIERWGNDVMTVGVGVYQLFRSIYFILPRALHANRVVAKLADLFARALFSSPRLKLKEQNLARLRAATVQKLVPTPVVNTFSGSGQYFDLYMQQTSVAQGGRDPSYAPLSSTPAVIEAGEPSILAFYLPQFHPFPENDKWWGKGFTEWTNVSKAVPQFRGHYQPRLPGELGFYDLRLSEIMARQIELAKIYGVSGFCFHYYWFDGHRLLEHPIETFLATKTKELDFPFCLCWANENWTRRWDGAEDDILMKQNHTPDDDAKVFADLFRYMSDSRYIRVDGKPVIVIYRPSIIPNILELVRIWRSLAEEVGLPGLYLVATNAFGFSTPAEIDFDANCQFPPHAVAVGEMNDSLDLLNPAFGGHVYPYDDAIEAWLKVLKGVGENPPDRPYFPGVMTGWDNEARKPGAGHVFHGATPAKFYRWLKEAVSWSKKHNPAREQFVFINAWNEWAEGTYLEPDRQFGYAYLAAVGRVRADAISNEKELMKIVSQVAKTKKQRSKTVVCIHIFYEDLIDEFASAITELNNLVPIDVIVSIPQEWSAVQAQRVIDLMDPIRLVVTENCGRDVWPFIRSLRVASALGYEIGCKLHSKKSAHLTGGGAIWRRGLVNSLVGSEGAEAALNVFAKDSRAGLVAPIEAMFSVSDSSAMRDNMSNVNKLLSMAGLDGATLHDFVAGTMFWFRFAALQNVIELPIDNADFGPELGAIDGTVAHAFERLFSTFVVCGGFKIANYDSQGAAAPY